MVTSVAILSRLRMQALRRQFEGFVRRPWIFYASALPMLGLLWLAFPEPSATTFDYLGMHLDWIWLRGMRSLSWRVFPLKFSDHHACWTRISL